MSLIWASLGMAIAIDVSFSMPQVISSQLTIWLDSLQTTS